MRFNALIVFIFMEVVLSSCFKEDIAVEPYMPPENVQTVSLQSSIYTTQIYFDLSTGEIMGENENSEWVLSFECGIEGWHIRVNSSDFWGIARTGSTNFDSVFSGNKAYTWLFDSSDGDPDSTAIGRWVDINSGQAVYSGEVFLAGQYNGIFYEPLMKLQFLYVDEFSYKFITGRTDDSYADTVIIAKVNSLNHVHYSFNGNKVMSLEPGKNDWDILFTQYSTILYTGEGVPTAYFVRGVFLNPDYTESALDTITDFIEIDYSKALLNTFSGRQDAIGYDWKEVKIDDQSNTAEYKIRAGYTYIIKDTEGDCYKLRFKNYFNMFGVKGYPTFEFTKLISE